MVHISGQVHRSKLLKRSKTYASLLRFKRGNLRLAEQHWMEKIFALGNLCKQALYVVFTEQHQLIRQISKHSLVFECPKETLPWMS